MAKEYKNILAERINPTKLKVYEQELSKIEKKYNGILKPVDIIEEAKAKNNPLHNYFDWDNEEAGVKWRLEQARFLMRTIKVKVMYEGGMKEYKKYLNVTIGTGKEAERGYVQTSIVLQQPNLKSQILKKALMDIEYWQNQYRDYNELENIFVSIKKTKKKLKKIIVNA